MKIDNQTLEMMKKEIDARVEYGGGWAAYIETYEKGKFHCADIVRDLQKRFCWDVYYATPGLNAKICMLPGVNDAHILTALKTICPKVERKY
jgi:hypothetical protein